MYEKSKLKEAGYFYSRMVSEIDNRDNLLFDLSAFLSAARSVLQYAFKEAQTKYGGQQWYDNHITSSKVLAFFKDKRDINVHMQPVQVNQHTSIQLTEVVRSSESIHIKKSTKLVDSLASIHLNHLSHHQHPKSHLRSRIDSLFLIGLGPRMSCSFATYT